MMVYGIYSMRYSNIEVHLMSSGAFFFVSLKYINIAMVTILKNVTNILTAVGEIYMFRKHQNQKVWTAMFLMVNGALLPFFFVTKPSNIVQWHMNIDFFFWVDYCMQKRIHSFFLIENSHSIFLICNIGMFFFCTLPAQMSACSIEDSTNSDKFLC